MIKQCLYCHKNFDTPQCHRAKYCSQKCYSLAVTGTHRKSNRKCSKQCPICHKTFLCYPSKITKYCSMKCYSAARMGMHLPGFISLNCEMCGKPMIVSKSESKRKFCSQSCCGKWQSLHLKGKNSPLWKHRIPLTCRTCGKVYSVDSYKSKQGHSHYCSRACKLQEHGKLIEGNRNGRWLNGKSQEPYPITFNNRIKESIRDRDNHRCQSCGILETELDRRLDIHHIDYDKGNLSPSNLISLCRHCHTRANSNREHWQSYFKRVLKSGLRQ